MVIRESSLVDQYGNPIIRDQESFYEPPVDPMTGEVYQGENPVEEEDSSNGFQGDLGVTQLTETEGTNSLGSKKVDFEKKKGRSEAADLEAELAYWRKRKELEELGGTKLKRLEKVTGKVGSALKWGYVASTGGGKLKKPDRGMYFPTSKAGMYIPTGMRDLNNPAANRSQPLKDAGTPRLEALRKQTDPRNFRMSSSQSTMGSKMFFRSPTPSPRSFGGPVGIIGSSNNLFRLKQLITPSGKTPIEQVILKQLQSTPEVDTRQAVVEMLVKMGIPRVQAEATINKLLSQGVIRNQQGGLEIA